MNRTKALPTISLFLLLLLCAGSLNAAGKIEVKNPWVREAPPGVSVMAAYFSLHNHAATEKALVSASSPEFKRVEMHRTEEQDGMAKMIAVHNLKIKGQGSLNFNPGGLHIMLINPKKPLKAGDSISLTLYFTDESSVKISVPVKKASAKMDHDMQHDMNHDMDHKMDHDMNHDMHEDMHDSHSHDHKH